MHLFFRLYASTVWVSPDWSMQGGHFRSTYESQTYAHPEILPPPPSTCGNSLVGMRPLSWPQSSTILCAFGLEMFSELSESSPSRTERKAGEFDILDAWLQLEQWHNPLELNVEMRVFHHSTSSTQGRRRGDRMGDILGKWPVQCKAQSEMLCHEPTGLLCVNTPDHQNHEASTFQAFMLEPCHGLLSVQAHS